MRLGSLLVLLLLGASPALAQPVVGLKAGAALSHLDTADGRASPTRVGLVIGAVVEVPLAARLSLQIEALYTEKGEADPDDAPPVRDLKMNYLEAPASLVLTVPVGRADGRVALGGYVAKRVADDVGSAGGYGGRRDLDYGGLVGLGLRSGRVVADVRYQFGLPNVPARTHSGGVRHRVLSLTVGYALVLQRHFPTGSRLAALDIIGERPLTGQIPCLGRPRGASTAVVLGSPGR